MNCPHCSFLVPQGASTCPNCGQPVVPQAPKTDFSKVQRSLKNTGTSVAALGWLSLVLNLGLYIWSLVDKNFASSGMPLIDTIGFVVAAIFFALYIILGNRLAKPADIHARKYIIILLVVTAALLAWTLYTGGKVGILFGLIVVYLCTSLYSVSKAMKSEEFKASLVTPQYKINKRGWIFFCIGAVLLVGAAIEFDFYRIQIGQYPINKTDLINNSVRVAKSQLSLPKQIDSVTTLVDITPEPDKSAILYHFTISNADVSGLTNEKLKNQLVTSVCQNPDTYKVLNQGIGMEYTYAVEGSPQTFFVSITKQDCPQK